MSIIHIVFCVILLCEVTYGYIADPNIFGPKFETLIDMQKHNLKEDSVTGPDLANWNKWTEKFPSNRLRDKYHAEDKEYVKQRIQWYDNVQAPQSANINKKPNYIQAENSNGKSNDDISSPQLLTQYWNKRESAPIAVKVKKVVADKKAPKKYSTDDIKLSVLKPDVNCTSKLQLCSKIPMKYLECVAHCYLSPSLAKPNTKFMYRLIYIFKSFAKYLCPTFGTIYDEIPAKIEEGLPLNSLKGFLYSLGVRPGKDPVDVDLYKNAPLALFNNLVKFVDGTEFELVKPILGTAESAAKTELSNSKIFPLMYHNPLCKKSPEKGWIISMIDSMNTHPVISDIFLRGYWVLTRALGLNLRYPLDSMFASWVMGIKLLAGVECSIIPYAENGKPFKCMQESSVDKILEEYTKEADESKNLYSWMVCGAHQVDIPDWIRDKMKPQELAGRSGLDLGDDQMESVILPVVKDPVKELAVLPNPEEFEAY